MIDAAEALRIGLVDRVVAKAELDEQVADYVKRVSRNAPLTISAAKMVLDRHPQSNEAARKQAANDAIAACYSSMCVAFRRDFAETSASARGSFGAAPLGMARQYRRSPRAAVGVAAYPPIVRTRIDEPSPTKATAHTNITTNIRSNPPR